MISPQLAASLKSISDLSSGYVFHPVVIQVAIDEALRDKRPVEVPSYVTSGYARQPKVCAVEGCDRTTHANSLCKAHYDRYQRGNFSDAPVRDRTKKVKKKREDRIARKQLVKRAVIRVMGGRCMMCAVEYPSDIYDFHHVFDKSREITRILGFLSPEMMALELSKCVLLCANCHRREHIWLRDVP